MDDGMFGIVYSLASHDDRLVAGGQIFDPSLTGMCNVVQWDGSVWKRMGAGLDSYAYALSSRDGELIAGGLFSTAGGNVSGRVARWRCAPSITDPPQPLDQPSISGSPEP